VGEGEGGEEVVDFFHYAVCCEHQESKVLSSSVKNWAVPYASEFFAECGKREKTTDSG